MSDARHDLVRLAELQKIYDQISTTLRERSSPPAEIQELEEANRRRREELEELEAAVADTEELLRDVRRQEQEYDLELKHFQRQKGMVTNEREFTAVISEIDYATKAREEASRRRAELEAELGRLAGEIESRRGSQPEDEAAQREIVDQWERRKDELKQEVHQLATEAQSIESELRPKNRSRFLRLLESKKGAAVVPLAEGSCSACHFAVRPHLQQRIRRCQEIITCEHCYRILYLPEALESPAEHPAPSG